MSIHRYIQAIFAWIGMLFWAPSAQERKAFELSEGEWARRYSRLLTEAGASATGPRTHTVSQRQRTATRQERRRRNSRIWIPGGLLALGAAIPLLAVQPKVVACLLVLAAVLIVAVWLTRRHTIRTALQPRPTENIQLVKAHHPRTDVAAEICMTSAVNGARPRTEAGASPTGPYSNTANHRQHAAPQPQQANRHHRTWIIAGLLVLGPACVLLAFPPQAATGMLLLAAALTVTVWLTRRHTIRTESGTSRHTASEAKRDQHVLHGPFALTCVVVTSSIFAADVLHLMAWQ
ncbi:hypothetical protein [Streptomyces griseorubiginosus]|uniref:Uncharacterized protein n=1 Tax=Streptomyces griseorubiginosus TaxID=67304 RepID=A0A101RN50_9ACTN|nr:hypothetical protein [Streptomyces griseorubiginosus]KUN58448.1 hypothetical protein AQJ54_42040 [Streptomyces griseorubiginosus]